MNRMISLWTNFAENGDPNPLEIDPMLNIKWIPVKGNQMNCLEIGADLKVGTNPEKDRMELWDDLVKLNSHSMNY